MEYNLNKDSAILIKDRRFILDNMTKVSSFKAWYDILGVNEFKYIVLEKYLEYFSKDCWYGALKKAKKEDIKDVILRIYKNHMGKQPLIDSINTELLARDEKRILNEKNLQIKTELLNIVESNVKDGLVSFTSRELDCLYYLIESGSISSYEELLEYGIAF